jgi:hypothetical protein
MAQKNLMGRSYHSYLCIRILVYGTENDIYLLDQ